MTFVETVAAAVREFAQRGYDDPQRLEHWLRELRAAADREAMSPGAARRTVEETLRTLYERLVTNGGVLRQFRGVQRFVLQHLEPQMRLALDRRILASVNLIKNNREEAVEKTLRRFSGWATSIPPGGSAEPGAQEAAADVRKALRSLPYAERRVAIDQGHKLTASIAAVVAQGTGAIAARWYSNYRQAGYDARPDHRERDNHVYLVRGSWAAERGLVRPGDVGYSDEITQPGEEVFCRCKFVYLYNLRDLPGNMVTEKGRAELERVRNLKIA